MYKIDESMKDFNSEFQKNEMEILELSDTTSEIQNLLDEFNIRLDTVRDTVRDWMSKLEDK